MIKNILFCSFFLVFSLKAGEIIELNPKFIEIIGKIESNNNDFAVGDKGKAISRFQIWEIYYKDAKNYDKSINFSYSSLTNKNNAVKVMTAYLNRYAREAVKNNDFEKLARIHNGGPLGYKKQSTIKYWQKFLANYEAKR